jgi:iron-sulfur cluster insertion protein
MDEQPFIFLITPAAMQRVYELFSQKKKAFFRVRVKGGGCSGFQYDFSLEDEEKHDDKVVPPVLIDRHSVPYLHESTLDYVEGAKGAYFEVVNPQAKSSCGCKKSFSL